jgi:ABC-type transport system involved in multi-copper enzyme maturation permease subunit
VRKADTIVTFNSPTKPRSIRVFERALARIFYKAGYQPRDYALIPVKDPPVVWKEMRKGFIGRNRGEAAIFVLLAGAFLIAAVLMLLSNRKNFFLPQYFIYALYLIVMIRTAIFSAGSITVEKEARTWPVLLATPLEDRDIVRGKAIAAFRRNVPPLLLYIILLSIMYLKIAGIKSILAIIFSLLPTAASILFVIGSGLYFGTRFRTTTIAVAAAVGLYFVITFLFCGAFNPLSRFLYMIVLNRAGQWLYFSMTIVRSLTIGALGLSLARCARRRIRRNIF